MYGGPIGVAEKWTKLNCSFASGSGGGAAVGSALVHCNGRFGSVRRGHKARGYEPTAAELVAAGFMPASSHFRTTGSTVTVL